MYYRALIIGRFRYKIRLSPPGRRISVPAKKNALYCGDNLTILRDKIASDSVDLIYLDPPFQSNQDYNLIFKTKDGGSSKSQIVAFEDTWEWGPEAQRTFAEMVDQGGYLAKALTSLRQFLSESDMMAYLSMMAPRLVEMRRVLRDGGSIYLHCDPTASHYLKMLMDAVFGFKSFQNEIIWSYRRWPSPCRRYQRMHDVILFYSKGDAGPKTFNVEYEPNSPSYEKRFKGKTQMLDPETRTRKITLETDSKGLMRRDVWEISIIAGFSKERLGYPTQKPQALLERIIRTSSNPGDVILDPFCGCGTAIEVANSPELMRRWIGIDITPLAISVVKGRLTRAFGLSVMKTFETDYEPKDMESARALAMEDPFKFQCWLVGLLGGLVAEQKRGPDRGVDGRIYFSDESSKGANHIVVSVKSGQNLSPSFIRDLLGTVERDQSAMGILACLCEPTRAMIREAASSGVYKSLAGTFPKIQIVTVEQLLRKEGIFGPARENIGKQKKSVRSETSMQLELKLPGIG